MLYVDIRLLHGDLSECFIISSKQTYDKDEYGVNPNFKSFIIYVKLKHGGKKPTIVDLTTTVAHQCLKYEWARAI